MKKKKRNENKKKKNIYSIIFNILTLLFLIFLRIVNIIPDLFFLILLGVIIIINIILTISIKKKKKSGYIMSILLLIIYIVLTYYLGITMNFFGNKLDYSEETYLVVALNDNKVNEVNNLKNKNIGYTENNLNNIDTALEKLNKKVKTNNIEYKDNNKLFESLISKSTEAIIIDETYYKIKGEEEDLDSYKIIYKIKIRSLIKRNSKTVDITKDSFTIYISGIDVYGDISTVSRSDVNILMTVNPTTKQVLLTSIPRDYYVRLHGTSGYKDKLTHAGNYGVNMSMDTIEELLNIDINYYVRVNFTTLETLIDSLDGVDVYSKYSFISYIDNYQFYEGYNHMNGKQALAFSRERKTLKEGDIDRGRNQEAVIEAIIRKATDKSVIYKYSKILNNLNNKFQTNITDKEITRLLKQELTNPGGWTITSTTLTGTGSNEYTYSYSGQKLYVMIPDQNSVTENARLINEVKKGIKLQSSYNNIIDNIKNPNQIVTPTPDKEEDKEVEKEKTDTTNEIEQENIEETNDDINNKKEEPNDEDNQNIDIDNPPIEGEQNEEANE